MRSYARNSPQAAGRVLVLALIADGRFCIAEKKAVHRLELAREVGLPADAIPELLCALREDLHRIGHSGSPTLAHINNGHLAALLSEVDDYALQRKLLHFVLVLVSADRQVGEAEVRLLDAMRLHWGVGAGARAPD